MTVITNLSRRDVLKGAATTSGSFSAFMSGFASSPLPRRPKCRRFNPMPFFPLMARAL